MDRVLHQDDWSEAGRPGSHLTDRGCHLLRRPRVGKTARPHPRWKLLLSPWGVVHNFSLHLLLAPLHPLTPTTHQSCGGGPLRGATRPSSVRDAEMSRGVAPSGGHRMCRRYHHVRLPSWCQPFGPHSRRSLQNTSASATLGVGVGVGWWWWWGRGRRRGRWCGVVWCGVGVYKHQKPGRHMCTEDTATPTSPNARAPSHSRTQPHGGLCLKTVCVCVFTCVVPC